MTVDMAFTSVSLSSLKVEMLNVVHWYSRASGCCNLYFSSASRHFSKSSLLLLNPFNNKGDVLQQFLDSTQLQPKQSHVNPRIEHHCDAVLGMTSPCPLKQKSVEPRSTSQVRRRGDLELTN